ncbi:sigma factor-like helix-turn-helix DNA-binding protein [Haloarchaeobius sp. DFWS5]|uniref:sigma-70 region 4 domain-containing protein n=1 Tax=Haloarchaeobius sp. DFWS5 TaxID=3446114 RepID=UPI003EBC2088
MATATSSGVTVPFSTELVAETAADHGVDSTELTDALVTIHADLTDGADAIHAYYVGATDDAPTFGGDLGRDDLPEPTLADDGLVEVIAVTDADWQQTTADLDSALAAAVEGVHADYAARVSAGAATVDGLTPLVVPSNQLSGLVGAGLSRRQAAVQVLRSGGMTQADIAARLGLDVGTVKSHAYRVDEKVREAKRLLDLVEDGASVTTDSA